MATKIYNIENVYTIHGSRIEILPLKIKYLRMAMDAFNTIEQNMNEDTVIDILCSCVQIAMQQYAPEYSYKLEDILDNFDLKTVYQILEYSIGIKINKKQEETTTSQTQTRDGANWDDFDLAKLETEAFLLGIWKNIDELETSISVVELIAIIGSKRDLDYEEKKFAAAMQGVDLDGATENDSQKAWEDMKARVFSNGATSDSKDILALQGQNAVKAGFGIGMGLDYEDLR
jgi:hypothetical protein